MMRKMQILAIPFISLLLYASCSFPGLQDRGSLLLSVGCSRSINRHPSASTAIDSLRIVLDSDERRIEQVHDYGTEILVSALTAGTWTLTVWGSNEEGHRIAQMQDGPVSLVIDRGEIAQAGVVMVPLTGEGTLLVNSILTGAYDRLADRELKLLIDNGTETAEEVLSEGMQGIALEAGWYEVTSVLFDGEDEFARKVFFPWIMAGLETEAAVSFEVFAIDYELNDGINHPGNSDAFASTSRNTLLLPPSRDGFIFLGWFSDEEFTQKVTKIVPGTVGDITLYAKWEEEL